MKTGTLFVVATPIGNLQDISQRALQILSQVDLIAAEDTRITANLLRHYAIATPLTALHDHNESHKIKQLTEFLQGGRDLALVSDAGTPLINDPGFQLVRHLHTLGIGVRGIPGPGAAIAALSIAGIPCDQFCYLGFPPKATGPRRQWLQRQATETRTLVIYESCHRIQKTLQDMRGIFGGQRQAALGRELTKQFETLLRGDLDDLCAILERDADQSKGEFVLVIAGAEASDPDREQNLRLLQPLLAELPLKQAVDLATRISGQPRKQLYKLALQLRDASDDDTSLVEAP
jgi:16S rRNA (cytidine1402-2'-O)-methyltransferase